MSQIKGTHFLTVDLRVQSKSELKELIDAFAPDVFELGSEDPQCAVFEVNTTYAEHFDGNGIFKRPTIDETIFRFLQRHSGFATEGSGYLGRC